MEPAAVTATQSMNERSLMMFARQFPRIVTVLVAVLVFVAQASAQQSSAQQVAKESREFRAAMAAHHICSGLWVVGRSHMRTPEEVVAQDVAPFKVFGWEPGFTYQVDYERRTVTVAAPRAPPRTAKYNGDQGSTILPRGGKDVFYKPVTVFRNLPDATKQPWPTGDAGATEPVPDGVDMQAVAAALDWAMEQKEQNTRAFVVAYQGKIVGERYAPGWTKDTPQISWSQGKSITAALIGSGSDYCTFGTASGRTNGFYLKGG